MTILERTAKERAKYQTIRSRSLGSLVNDPDLNLEHLIQTTEDGEWVQELGSQAMLMLQTYSIIRTRKDNILSMHDLVHEWIAQKLDDKTSGQMAQVARTVLIESVSISTQSTERIILQQMLSPHFQLCVKIPGAGHPLAEALPEDARRLGIPVPSANPDEPARARHSVAGTGESTVDPVALGRGLEDFSEDMYGCYLLWKLGWFYKSQKMFPEAEKCLQKSVDTHKLEYGSNDDSVTDALQTLAELYHEMGRLGDAEGLCMEALDRIDWRFEEYREDDWILVKRRETPAEAMTRVLVDDETRLELKSRATVSREITTIKAQVKLSEVLIDEGRWGPAKSFLRNALETAETYEFSSHILEVRDRLQAASKKGGDMDYWNNRVNAENALTGEDLEEATKSEHHCRIMRYWADCVYHQGEELGVMHTACKVYKALLPRYARYYDRSDRNILYTMRQIVRCLLFSKDRRYEEAINLASDCLSRARHTYGEYHPETVQALETHGLALLWSTSDMKGAGLRYHKDALERALVCLGPGHFITKRISNRVDQLGNPRPSQTGSQNSQLSGPTPPFLQHLEGAFATIFDEDDRPKSHEEIIDRLSAKLGPRHSIVKQLEEEWGESLEHDKARRLRSKIGEIEGPEVSLRARNMEQLPFSGLDRIDEGWERPPATADKKRVNAPEAQNTEQFPRRSARIDKDGVMLPEKKQQNTLRSRRQRSQRRRPRFVDEPGEGSSKPKHKKWEQSFEAMVTIQQLARIDEDWQGENLRVPDTDQQYCHGEDSAGDVGQDVEMLSKAEGKRPRYPIAQPL